MIKVYKNGKSFIEENHTFLDLNKYASTFFYLDAKLLNEVSKTNYAIKVEKDKDTLLALKVEPYNLLLYGCRVCLKELLEYLSKEEYEVEGILCEKSIGDELITLTNDKYYLSMGMDFMEARSFTLPSSKDVVVPTLEDVDEIYDSIACFIKDCGLTDPLPKKERVIKNLPNYRVIKIDGKIVSMASFSEDTKDSYRITNVYTKPEYRGKSYAKKIVNNIKNEILDMGKLATLNVDINNPISYHIYESLGFKRIFTQGIYLRK